MSRTRFGSVKAMIACLFFVLNANVPEEFNFEKRWSSASETKRLVFVVTGGVCLSRRALPLGHLHDDWTTILNSFKTGN